jgi:hypothetical protein
LHDFVRLPRAGRVVVSKEMTMTPAQLTLAAILSISTAAAAPALACGPRAETETVTGVYPRITWTYAPWEQLALSYPRHDGAGPHRYVEDFRVDRDDALDALAARIGTDHPRISDVTVTLERTIGAKTWHVVRVSSRP